MTVQEQNVRLESAEEEKIDLKELENLGVDLVKGDLSPLPQNNSVLLSVSDDDINEQESSKYKKSNLPEIKRENK